MKMILILVTRNTGNTAHLHSKDTMIMIMIKITGVTVIMTLAADHVDVGRNI